jgi:hypothetical protein
LNTQSTGPNCTATSRDSAFDHWFDQSAERREGRRGRLAEAEPLVPRLVWLALFLGGGLIIVYMCFYADPREPAFVQALMVGSVTTMVVAGLLVVRFLDRPYTNASGSIKPTAMTAHAAPDGTAGHRIRQQPGATLRRTRTAARPARLAWFGAGLRRSAEMVSRRADLSLQVGVSQWPEPSLT